MRLVSFRVQNFKSIEDSGEIPVDRVTCLVGKNESGKTALFEALTKLNPVEGLPTKFDYVEDYPRKRVNEYKRRHETAPDPVVTGTFELSQDETEALEKEFGPGVLKSGRVEVTKKYSNTREWALPLDEAAHVKFLVKQAGVSSPHAKSLAAHKTVDDLLAAAEAVDDATESVENLASRLRSNKETLFATLRQRIIDNYLPQLFYFDEYSTLRGTISLHDVKDATSQKESEEENLTALALIELVGASVDEFLERQNYERLKANLEAASNEITDQLFTYWKQNTQLEVEFDLQPVIDEPSQRLRDTNLKIRIRNVRHRVTVDFDKRSRGFVWFFSFLVAFSKFRERGERLVLVLDEPGLNLHAKAQADLLHYIEDGLAPHHQVLYSTHSPFMIDAERPERIRTVEDLESGGTKVSADPFETDPDTIFPLQAALGYDLTQTLFVGPNTLLVEGPSDLIYLTHASSALKRQGRQGLAKEWVLVPVGGADKVATFVSLLGANKLNVVIFLDVSQNAQQRLQAMLDRNLIMSRNLLTVGSVIGSKNADIEDMFTPDRYIELINASFAELSKKPLTAAKIGKGDPRIVKRLEAYFAADQIGNGFSHYAPAFTLMSDTGDLAQRLFDAHALDNFEKAFGAINPLLRR